MSYPKIRQITIEELEAELNQEVARYDNFVIGSFQKEAIGSIHHDLGNNPSWNHPYKIVSETTFDDWMKRSFSFLSPDFDYEAERKLNAHYYCCVTD
jgi:hypothetical protein